VRAQLDEECVIKANSQFWEQMLAMTLSQTPVPEDFCVEAGHILGSVRLSGEWKGRIEVRLASGLAYQATAAMMMQPVDTVGEADALDATKEIANMIAGTIKSSLPRPCAMTVPESFVESEGFCGQPRTEDSLVVTFHHAAGDLMVRVWEQECRQPQDAGSARPELQAAMAN
jgi:CheY-specific phosphatase CheX